MPESDPLPDPVAYARGLSDEALEAYRETFGEDSREWIIARRELARRAGPSGWRIAAHLAAGVGLVLLVRSCWG